MLLNDIPKVLVIEDEPDLRDFMVQCLSIDYQVESAESAQQGLAAAQRFLPDAIVCDFNMPGANGLTVLHGIRENPATAHIAFVLPSGGVPPTESLHHSIAFLPKPFGLDALFAAVEAALGSRCAVTPS